MIPLPTFETFSLQNLFININLIIIFCKKKLLVVVKDPNYPA